MSDGRKLKISNINLYNKYLLLLEEENKRQNLIRYKTRDELIKKHLEDSLMPFESGVLEPLAGNIMDIGSGGGFPAIPLAIRYHNAMFTLVESEKRKAQFLQKAIRELGLNNTEVVNQRVEVYSKEKIEQYDFCIMRALAATRICLEYAAPSLKLGSKVYLYKGPAFMEELSDSQNAMKELGIEFEKTISYEYTFCGEKFTPLIAVFKKRHKTLGKYPRRPGMAKKNPL